MFQEVGGGEFDNSIKFKAGVGLIAWPCFKRPSTVFLDLFPVPSFRKIMTLRRFLSHFGIQVKVLHS